MIPALMEFEKWHSIRSREDGVSGVLAWVAWMACLQGWRDRVGSVGGVVA